MTSYTPMGSVKPKGAQILGPPPISGSISVYAQKLTSLAFVTLCSTVVAGHQCNHAAAFRVCPVKCRWHIVLGVFSLVYTLMLLVANYFAEGRRNWREGWFTHGREFYLIGLLVVVWLPGVATVSSHEGGDNLQRWFTWLAFFGSIYASFKAYHSYKEEDLPTVLPDGFDEEDFVYG